MANPLPALLLSSFAATLELVLLVSVGIVFRLTGIVSKSATRTISKMCFYCITPCFLSMKVAESISMDLIRQAWTAPLFAVFLILISFILGNLLFGCVLRVRGLKLRLAVLACCFGNFTTIPMIFLTAIARTGVFPGDQDATMDEIISKVSMFLPPNTVLIFSFAFLYMSTGISPNDPCVLYQQMKLDHAKGIKQKDQSSQDGNVVSSINQPSPPKLYANLEDPKEEEEERKEDIAVGSDDDALYFENNQDEPVLLEEEPSPKTMAWKKILRIIQFIFQRILTVPVIAIFIGAILGLIPGVQPIIKKPPVIVSNLVSVLHKIGNGFFILTMVILGSNLAGAAKNRPLQTKGFFRTYIIKFNQVKTVIGVVVLKLIIMPLITLGVVNGMVLLGWVQRDDPILMMCLFIEGTTPCALTLGMLCNLNSDLGVDEISELTIFEYLVTPLLLIVWTMVFLYNACHYSQNCNL